MSTIIEEKTSGFGIAESEYLAPRVKVVEVCMRHVICQSVPSGGSLQTYDEVEEEWN